MSQTNSQIQNLIARPPIVVVLGHVDHGKTTLLDYIRKTKVAEKETGGITQHIGAYEIEEKGRKITFIDTPGHEAFTQIRSRGVKVADIALLVIAADEGVKPQTKESFSYIKQAQIPFIAVLTKIDKDSANPEKVKKDLTELGIYLENWGGDVPLVEVSSKSGQGIDDLLDLILLMAEIAELKAEPNQPVAGIVVESHLDSKKGITATVIITNGTLRLKDKITAGQAKGKIKILEDFRGNLIENATFSSPVRIIGFETLPPVGEEFFISGEGTAEAKDLLTASRVLAKQIGDKNSLIKIPLIIKSDTFSSSEALEHIIDQVGQEKNWLFSVLKNDIGDLSESDLKIVPQEKTMIIVFRVNKKPEIANIFLTNKNLLILEGEIIYEIGNKIIELVENQFIHRPTEEIIGKLEILAVFNPEKGNQLVGGKMIEGLARNKIKFRLLRNDEILSEGKVNNLQRNRVDVSEVNTGLECGVLIDCPKEIIKGDVLEFFQKI